MAAAWQRGEKEWVVTWTKKCLIRLEDLPEALRADKEVALAAFTVDNANRLDHVSEALRADKDVVLAAVRHSGDNLRYASKALWADKDVVLAAVRKGGVFTEQLKYTSKALRADREVVLAAVTGHAGFALQYASKALRADKEVVLAAARGGSGLRYASKALRADKEVVMAAIREYGDELKYASKALRADFVLNAHAVCNARCVDESWKPERENLGRDDYDILSEMRKVRWPRTWTPAIVPKDPPEVLYRALANLHGGEFPFGKLREKDMEVLVHLKDAALRTEVEKAYMESRDLCVRDQIDGVLDMALEGDEVSEKDARAAVESAALERAQKRKRGEL